jgi:hypothetical protein
MTTPRPDAYLTLVNDRELMANVSNGRVESFVDLYDRYYDRGLPCRASGL